MSNKMALDALTAIQDAIGMPTSGDSSDFVWPKSTMRHPGETAYGWICEKHGLGYQSGCICCAGDLKAYREQKDREARYAREDAIRDASKKVRAAIAALQAEPQPEQTASISLGPVAFEFAHFQQWVNKASTWFGALHEANSNAAQRRYLCIDAAGRVCMIGRDFSRARDEGKFPVRVHLIDALPATPPKD